MNDTAATNLVKSTFENPYNGDRFLTFARNLFHSFEPATFVYRGNYIPDAYKKQIKTLERIGKYEDREGNKIDILAVCLTQGSALERARTLQRNFISWYLNGSRGEVTKDAALVAFYVEDSKDWRLSLVKMEYRLDKSESGRLKTFTELTPAKRFSFFVGEGENTHTAQRQLLPLLRKEDTPPTLADLEKTFSVEVVTKEFFEKYKQLFLDTKEALDTIIKADSQIQSDFQDKNIETVDFVKKLLGQVVFLYFLQKKGWFGVERDKAWGTGPKEFLRLLFEKNITEYDNFFNDILEPLFYEALALERPDDFYSRFNCKIPFLNGGLFDPLNNYDWVHTDIRLPNNLFSNNEKTKEGDVGTGILDVFDRYNFTVKEDEPLEKEVAVDPEMLGKVFENLLEVKDRKSKGTYYTPREIVHYMCQESLVNYLVTELDSKVNKDDIETLVQIGEAAVEHDTRVTELGEETATYSYKLPASVRENAKAIDEALVNIRVCDPAVGSGAFLVGMMTEIIRVRNTISSYLTDGDRSIYTFKHHAIQNSLYGVDIDPGATEIAKLRLWLSLIVDEQDIKRIKPLPNLDYKIMQGNSLLEEYEGIKLFDEELFSKSAFDNSSQIADIKEKMSELQRKFFELHSKGEYRSTKMQQIEAELKRYSTSLKKMTQPPKVKAENTGLFDQMSEAKQKADELKRLQKEFFNTAHKKEKDRIKKQIETLTWEFIEATLREQGKESLITQIEKFKKTNIKPFFLWKLNFSEIFEKNEGFDIIIANPPYMGQKMNNDIFRVIKSSKLGFFHQRRMDLFYFFFHLGLNILRDGGILSFITTNYYITATGADKLRKDLQNRSTILTLINFNELKIFENASGQHNLITILQKGHLDKLARTSITAKRGYLGAEILNKIVDGTDPQTMYYYISQDKLFDNGMIKLTSGGVDDVLDKVLAQSNKLNMVCDISTGIQTGAHKLSEAHINKYGDLGKIGDGIFVLSKDELFKKSISQSDPNVKPWFKNSDIKKYMTNLENDEYLLYVLSHQVSKELIRHFEKYKPLLINRNIESGVRVSMADYDAFVENKKKLKYVMQHSSFKLGFYFNISYPRKQAIFENEKIVSSQWAKSNIFGWNNIPWYGGTDLCVITLRKHSETNYRLKTILGILNSKIIYNWLYFRGKRKGELLELTVTPLSNIPIPLLDTPVKTTIANQINDLVDQILTIKYKNSSTDTKILEEQIDQLVYKLYGLSEGEIKLIESNTS